MQYIVLQAAGAGGSMMFPLMMIGMFAIMYFFMIRPQQKKQKDQKAFEDNLKKGDKIVTIAGIHGKIVNFSEDGKVAIIEVDTNTRIKIERTSISMEYTKASYANNSTENA